MKKTNSIGRASLEAFGVGFGLNMLLLLCDIATLWGLVGGAATGIWYALRYDWNS